MTNPTPPLTAEETVVAILDAAVIHHPLKDDDFLYNPEKAVEIIEAYAAKQNAELVAENERLKQHIDDAVLTIQIAANENERLKTENERLKQAAALYREASFQGHSSHWDSQGTKLIADVKRLRRALTAAYREINEIKARSGAPLNELGCMMVDEEYFASVVDLTREALAATNRPEYKEVG